jgi:hypothetical protein
MKKIKLHGKHAEGIYKYALVDDALYPFLSRFTWLAKPAGSGVHIYATTDIWIGGVKKMVRMHRLIMNASPGELIDHKNGHTTDNQEYNLRPATRNENGRNVHKSRFKGCYYDKRYKVWWGRIKYDHQSIGLGTYDTEVDCAIAYNYAALKYFGEFASFNHIPDWRSVTPVRHVKKRNPYQSNNKSGIPGVCYHSQKDKWQTNFNKRYIGIFNTKEDAIEARNQAEADLANHASMVKI